jgi:predicted dienelactone hydrolase
MRKLSAILLLLLVVGAILANGKQPEAFPPQSQSASRLKPGPLAVRSQRIALVDDSRPTAPNGSYAGDSFRRLKGKVWYPASSAQGPYPLIVYSHGFSSMKEGGAYLAAHLASLGYVAVAVDYPLTNIAAPGGPNVFDVVNQPGDITFLIDSLISLNDTPGSYLEGMVDGTRIGLVGLSLGGMTTTLASFHPELRDPRVGAAISIAGPTNIFSSKFFTHAEVPFLMIAADDDALVAYATNALPVPTKVPGGALVTLAGGSHSGFAGIASLLRWIGNADALGCWLVLRSADDAFDEPWNELLGSEEIGIEPVSIETPCSSELPPVAMNPLRQQMITAVAVSSFFESRFAPTPEKRDAARFYLSRTFAEEIPEADFRD